MVEHTCPLCGGPTDKPMLFRSIRLQQAFGFIWDNPNCSTGEVALAVAQTRSYTNLLIGEVRQGLESTEYRLITSSIAAKRGRPARYKIVQLKPQPKPTTEGIPDGTV